MVVACTSVLVVFLSLYAPWIASAHALWPEPNSESYNLLHKAEEQARLQQESKLPEYGESSYNACKLRAPQNRPLTFFSEGFGAPKVYAPSTGAIKAGLYVS
jgi:hypothetical protein